ncbi:MAG: response regulator transcription factor [Methylococcales bacterium]|nr:response regulator transcription factor [Methylococcales bacterium]MBT7443770.1 response regulator transcription factor [Methylococcales bacterium]
MHILLVEDEIALAEGLQSALKREGFVVNHVALGQSAISAVPVEKPDIMILDLGLPDMDGIDVLKKVRSADKDIPILILTARNNLEDKIKGLDNGADDYLAKPFEMPELFARIRVLGRRLSSIKQTNMTLGVVSLDVASHEVEVEGEQVLFSRHEYMLLKALMENSGRVQTRQALEAKLYSWGEEVASNALEVHIHKIRKKLPADFIKTVRGVGYTIKKT